MMIPKITPAVDYNLWSKRMDTQLIETTNKNLMLRLLSQRIRKYYYKSLRTSVINSQMSPSNQSNVLRFQCFFLIFEQKF